MPIITTGKLGLNEADPKPVHQVNWLGHPMKEGDNYRGESEPQPQPPPPPKVMRVPRKAKGTRKAWSPEARAAYSQKMKAWWQAKRANSAPL